MHGRVVHKDGKDVLNNPRSELLAPEAPEDTD